MYLKRIGAIFLILTIVLALITACGDTSVKPPNKTDSGEGREPLGENMQGLKITELSLEELKEPSDHAEGVFTHGSMAGVGTFHMDLKNGKTLRYESKITNRGIPAPYTPQKTTITFYNSTQDMQAAPLRIADEYGAFEIRKVYETPRFLLISGSFRDGRWQTFHAVYLLDMQTRSLTFINEVLNRNSVRIRNCFPGYVEVEVCDIPGWPTIDLSHSDNETLFYRILFDEKAESNEMVRIANKYKFRELLKKYTNQTEQMAGYYRDESGEEVNIRNRQNIIKIINYLDTLELYKVIKDQEHAYEDRMMAFRVEDGEEVLIGRIGEDILTISLSEKFYIKEFTAYVTTKPIDASYIRKLLHEDRAEQ
ncbi:MAG: hypothetical protein K0R93_267 [Anaerosolibacter sp.]|uniref:hypothetical protein n=1 Tax=Anaerosolibacter sp. TaxID=1872527 RepID=UPI00262D509F|nr:hypothetical protein [Anaerosolibacter sp.]MDF2545369.1 hypothetical protein [Anaerosolibacter sp.]